ncbi:MAG TPA: DeoR family transcriptional regulator, partial [Dehalococcoidia bacterium]|nr:DeoR family transcriptional regulator [Dehalococcoidia bacterium]
MTSIPGSLGQTRVPMLAPVRQTRILDKVRRTGTVRVGDLALLLGVSVRCNLEALARRGLVSKVHGGATSVDFRSTDEPGFEHKPACAPLEKDAFPAYAASRVSPGTAVGLTTETTNGTRAHRLRGVPDLTVVTR